MNRADEKTKEFSVAARLFNLKTLLSLLLALLLLLLVFRNLDFKSTLSSFSGISITMFLLTLLVHYSSYVVRAFRYRLLLKQNGCDPGYFEAFRLLILAFFANGIIPGKPGDLYRSYLLNKYHNLPFLKALGAAFAERTSDVAVIITLFAASTLVILKTSTLPEQMMLILKWALVILVLLLTSLLVIFLLGRKWPLPVEHSKWKGIRSLAGWFLDFREGVIRSFTGAGLKVIGLSALIWIIESVRFLLVMKMLSLTVDRFLAVPLALAASLLAAFPLTPSGLGAVEGAMTIVISSLGVNQSLAISVILLDRIITYWILVFIGWIVYLTSKRV